MQQGVASWFDRFANQLHVSQLWCPAAFLDVTFSAGTNDIRPAILTAHTAGDNMVEAQIHCGKPLAAILAGVTVTAEDVSSVELDFASRKPVVK